MHVTKRDCELRKNLAKTGAMRSPRTTPSTNSGDDSTRMAAPSLTGDDQLAGTYPEILREYASSGFRDDLRGSLLRRPRVRRSTVASQRGSDQVDRSIERYGELGPFWNRRG